MPVATAPAGIDTVELKDTGPVNAAPLNKAAPDTAVLTKAVVAMLVLLSVDSGEAVSVVPAASVYDPETVPDSMAPLVITGAFSGVPLNRLDCRT
jgi:hypothetical protein